ncbi:hypothetical protein PQX77_010121 [Marasmius sp. AFHP31]|nr:hypothetical protein PQX77_010121 [Marasmius sp. AFHP31]
MNNGSPLPHVQRLLRSCISSSEQSLVSEQLRDAEKELRCHEIEINKLKAALLSLENKRSRLTHKIHQFRSLLAPIHRLPTEMLANIFKHAIHGKSYYEQISRTQASTVFTLSVVCGRWREIILSTPSLWSYISFQLNDWLHIEEYDEDDMPLQVATDMEVEISRLARIVQLFLKRSQSTQLDLDLNFVLISPSETRSFIAVRRMCDVLFPTAQRWRSLNIAGQAPTFDSHALYALFSNLSSLKHLGLPGRFWSGRPLSGCPSLTSISLREDVNPAMLLVPWQQVKRLDFTGYSGSIEKVADILRSCSGVEDLTLELAPFAVPTSLPIVVPFVRSFTVKGFNASRAGPNSISIFQCLSLPQLTVLSIIGDETHLGIEAFADFLRRSSCNITHLTIQTSDEHRANKDVIIPFLRLLPTLKVLRLEESRGYGSSTRQNECVSRTILRQLSSHQRCDSDSPFLPRLSELILSIYGRSLDTDALLEAVTSRWLPAESDVGVDCLRSLTLEMRDSQVPSLEPLHYLRDAGLRVEIFGLPY